MKNSKAFHSIELGLISGLVGRDTGSCGMWIQISLVGFYSLGLGHLQW